MDFYLFAMSGYLFELIYGSDKSNLFVYTKQYLSKNLNKVRKPAIKLDRDKDEKNIC